MFNTHGNKTSNGKTITEGMRVIDYDRNKGVVVKDTNCETWACQEGYCRNDHWFDVKRDGMEGTSYMNGERLVAI